MRIFRSLVVALIILSLAAATWYFRPWSKYSPSLVAKLQKPEYLVSNFQNMSDLIPSTLVAKGANSVELNEKLADLNFRYEFKGETKTLDTFLDESSTMGLLVLKNGELLHEQYRQGATRESLFTSWSVAKSFVATTIAMALKEGLITSLDDQVQQYATQYEGTDYGKSTLHQLLAMSSGIDFEEDYSADDSDIKKFFFNSFIFKKDPDALLAGYQRNREPLSDFHYISSNSHVLSAVVRAVYKKPLAQIISDKIWQPLGMEADANWLKHSEGAEGVALGYCCLNARLRDYARFGQFYLDGAAGRGLASELLPAGWMSNVSEPATQSHRRASGNYANRGYSLHFWLPEKEPEAFMAVGVYGQFIWIDPSRELVIARNSADPTWTPRYSESEAVMRAIAEAYD